MKAEDVEKAKLDPRLRRIKQIGVVGGTFDPIHWGHLSMAEIVREALQLDEVAFVPDEYPPHKAGAVAEFADRCHMVRQAVADHSSFRYATVKREKAGPCYIVDTLTMLKEQIYYLPDTEIFYIIGADSLLEIKSWHRWEHLFDLCHLVVTSRPSVPDAELKAWVQTEFAAYATRIKYVPCPGMAVSSTLIRQRASQGKTIRYLVHPAVHQYVAKNYLYRPQAHEGEYDLLGQVGRRG